MRTRPQPRKAVPVNRRRTRQSSSALFTPGGAFTARQLPSSYKQLQGRAGCFLLLSASTERHLTWLPCPNLTSCNLQTPVFDSLLRYSTSPTDKQANHHPSHRLNEVTKRISFGASHIPTLSACPHFCLPAAWPVSTAAGVGQHSLEPSHANVIEEILQRLGLGQGCLLRPCIQHPSRRTGRWNIFLVFC